MLKEANDKIPTEDVVEDYTPNARKTVKIMLQDPMGHTRTQATMATPSGAHNPYQDTSGVPHVQTPVTEQIGHSGNPHTNEPHTSHHHYYNYPTPMQQAVPVQQAAPVQQAVPEPTTSVVTPSMGAWHQWAEEHPQIIESLNNAFHAEKSAAARRWRRTLHPQWAKDRKDITMHTHPQWTLRYKSRNIRPHMDINSRTTDRHHDMKRQDTMHVAADQAYHKINNGVKDHHGRPAKKVTANRRGEDTRTPPARTDRHRLRPLC